MADYTPSEKLEAAKVALAHNIRLQTLVDACEAVSDEMAQLAFNVQRQWWDRNWSIVAVANAEFSAAITSSQMQLGPITGQLDALRFELESKKIRDGDIVSTLRKSNQPESLCRFYLSQYRAGEFDLSNNEAQLPVLKRLQSDYPLVAESTPKRVPQITFGLSAQPNAGRSTVSAQRLAKEVYCGNGEVLNVLNQWPREVYGAYCAGRTSIAIECEWGECKVLNEIAQ